MATTFLSISLIAFTMMLSACGETKYADVSTLPSYRELIGATYTVIGPVNAYGIQKHSNAALDYVTLIPPPGIEGSEIGFQVPIAAGSILTVISVYQTNRFFDSSITFGVKLTGSDRLGNLPIRIDLMRGNQGAEKHSLSPKIYRKN